MPLSARWLFGPAESVTNVWLHDSPRPHAAFAPVDLGPIPPHTVSLAWRFPVRRFPGWTPCGGFGPRTMRSARGRHSVCLRRIGGGLGSRTNAADRDQQSAPTTGSTKWGHAVLPPLPERPECWPTSRRPYLPTVLGSRRGQPGWIGATQDAATRPPPSAQHRASLVAPVMHCCSTAPIKERSRRRVTAPDLDRGVCAPPWPCGPARSETAGGGAAEVDRCAIAVTHDTVIDRATGSPPRGGDVRPHARRAGPPRAPTAACTRGVLGPSRA